MNDVKILEILEMLNNEALRMQPTDAECLQIKTMLTDCLVQCRAGKDLAQVLDENPQYMEFVDALPA